MSLDGKIATATGDSKWISGDASRRRVHELRGRMDAIVIGSGTAGADDEVHVFLAPRLIGGAAALTAVAGRGVEKVAEALPLAEWRIEQLGSDVLLHGRVRSP